MYRTGMPSPGYPAGPGLDPVALAKAKIELPCSPTDLAGLFEVCAADMGFTSSAQIKVDAEAIFQPFVRTSSARGRNSAGPGIGLAIVARACRAHGGTVAARNLGGGCLHVSLCLPVEA